MLKANQIDVFLMVCSTNAKFLGCKTTWRVNRTVIAPGDNVTINGFWYSCDVTDLRIKYQQGKIIVYFTDFLGKLKLWYTESSLLNCICRSNQSIKFIFRKKSSHLEEELYLSVVTVWDDKQHTIAWYC